MTAFTYGSPLCYILTMNFSSRIKLMAAALILGASVTANGAQKSPWNFEVGIGTRSLTPIVLLGGFSYNNLNFRLQGLGFHNGPRDYWCGVRGSLLWTLFNNSPFQISLGLGSGYEYAQAPNDMHKALNEANHAKYVYTYNYKENFDVSAEAWTNIYGIYTQISIPLYRFRTHDVSNYPKWSAGYIFKF